MSPRSPLIPAEAPPGADDMLTARRAGLVACHACGKVYLPGEPACGRCGAALHSRAPGSLSRVWAWWVAGLIVYIPANVPHLPYNLSETEPCTAVIARTDPNEQESVVLLPHLDALRR